MARPKAKSAKKNKNDTSANLGYEAQLWQMADALRNNMDAAEYKQVVLGKTISPVGDVACGRAAVKAKDTSGRVYEYSLARFASAEGKGGGQFYTPSHESNYTTWRLANDGDWCSELLKDDKRWVYGTPPVGNAHYAWVQRFIHYLAPAGLAGFVLANGSMSSNQSGEGEIRKSLIEADLVDCMVALPS